MTGNITQEGYFASIYRGIEDRMCDLSVFYTLTRGAATNPSVQIGIADPEKHREMKHYLSRIQAAKHKLSVESRMILTQFGLARYDVLLMARDLHIRPRHARVSLRRAIDELKTVLFRHTAGKDDAEKLTGIPSINLRLALVHEQERVQLQSELDMFLYIGALERGNAELAGLY